MKRSLLLKKIADPSQVAYDDVKQMIADSCIIGDIDMNIQAKIDSLRLISSNLDRLSLSEDEKLTN